MADRKRNATNRPKTTDAPHPSPASHSSHEEGFIPPHGGYANLLSYQKSQIIYDATVKFCDRFIDRKSRTHDQMVQAARSGNKNIAEGSQVSGTSKESELKLVNVARGSLEELLGDYQDYLRQHGLRLWEKNSREALFVRKLGAKPDTSYESYRTYFETRPPEVVANILICLIHQANYLLDQQLRRLEQDFLKEGGLRERMTRARLAARRISRSRARPPPDWRPPRWGGERRRGVSEWREMSLGDFVGLQRGHDLTDGERRPSNIPVMGSAGMNGYHDTALAKGPGVVVGRSGASFGQVHFCPVDYWPHNTTLYVTNFRGNDPRFTYYYERRLLVDIKAAQGTNLSSDKLACARALMHPQVDHFPHTM